MHAILHFFTYPLKPLTQAPISIQPMPILYATHNHVLPYSDAPHPEYFSAATPPGCITSEILLRLHSTRMSYIWNSSPPSFYPDVSHPEFPAVISPRMPHIRNSFPPPLNPDILHLKFFSATTPPEYLTSGIRSANVPPSPDVSHPESYPTDVLPSPDVSHPESYPPTFNLLLHP